MMAPLRRSWSSAPEQHETITHATSFTRQSSRSSSIIHRLRAAFDDPQAALSEVERAIAQGTCLATSFSWRAVVLDLDYRSLRIRRRRRRSRGARFDALLLASLRHRRGRD